jgi:hypothetical protein
MLLGVNIDWSFPEWLAIVSFPLLLIGLGLALQQSRGVKTLASDAAKQLDGPQRSPHLKDVIGWLIERRVIPVEDHERWDAVRERRNAASHPERQDVMPPGAVLSGLQAAGHDINRLFARDPGGVPRAAGPGAG